MASHKIPDFAPKFEESRSKARDYPKNLLRTDVLEHSLEYYQKRLAEGRVFHPTFRKLACIDLYEKNDAFHLSKTLDTVEKLSDYIDEEDGIPLWRIIFIQSATSRERLGCSKEQLTFLLTYYQVMPSFLDFVLSFKKRVKPITHALFRHENYLEQDSLGLSIPELSRSGIQIQHAFNLLSIERTTEASEKNQWPLRQIALYHCFDVTNGRCLWILLKGDQTMVKRIFSATKAQRHLNAKAITDRDASFAASLQVHMITMEWCTESWTEYVDFLEEEINSHSSDAKVAPVEETTRKTELDFTYSPRSTFQSNQSRQSTFDGQSPASSPPASPIRQTFRRSSSDLFSIIKRVSGLKSSRSNTLVSRGGEDDIENPTEDIDHNDHLTIQDLNDNFSFKSFQRLRLLGDSLDQAIGVIEQNKVVLKAIKGQYQLVTSSHGFTTHMNRKDNESQLMAFFRKIQNIEQDLNVHHDRLRTLSRVVENDKVMFGATLQYISGRTSEYFANCANTSSERMEDWTVKMHKIAVRTEQETVSMHVITIFTMIFLPGTFIATFFSSGVLHWDDDGTLGSAWVIRREGMKLFFSICLPMMVVIILAWSVLYWFTRRASHDRPQQLLLPVTEQQTTEKQNAAGAISLSKEPGFQV